MAKPILDDLDNSQHNTYGLSTRHEAMVRLSETQHSPTANTATADVTTVKVPEMAESITEGTLKQWSKREGYRCKHPHMDTDSMQRLATTWSRMRRSPPSRPTRSTFP